MSTTLIIGAGGVGSAVAHKCAQHNDELGELVLASRTVEKCERVVAEIGSMGNAKDPERKVRAAQVDAMSVVEVEALIRETGAERVLNTASPYCNMTIMEGCLNAGVHYVDTAVAETEGEPEMPAPWYANYEWPKRPRFSDAGLTGILGIGFDPGAVNVFCAYVAKHHMDVVESIDIMDVNAGDHGQFFATNFDPETNLREIAESVVYWEDGQWAQIPCHSKSRTYDFPVVGKQRVYSMGHDELHSLAINIPARRIEFWMGFNDRYIATFKVLKELGLISSDPVDVGGVRVAPIKVLKALLPEPTSLAAGYSGQVCIGCLVKGVHSGKPRSVFIYTTCDHAQCYREIGSQAISYTTAVPMVTAALLLKRGDWKAGTMVNVEELNPDPFMALMPEIGLDWQIREEEDP